MALLGLKIIPTKSGIAPALARLKAKHENLKPAMENAATELTRRIKYRFQFKQDPDGKRWAPPAKSTQETYKRDALLGRKRSLMLNTRNLRDRSKFIPTANGIRAVMGTEYGRYHEQPSGSKAARKIPRRAFLLTAGGRGLAKNDEKYLLNAIRYQLYGKD
jgi:phage gpG-like protein